MIELVDDPRSDSDEAEDEEESHVDNHVKDEGWEVRKSVL